MLPDSLVRRSGWKLFVGLFVAGLLMPAAHAEDKKTDNALSKAPADAAFYASGLRNKQQVMAFYKSNAYKKLRAIKSVQLAYEHIQKQMKKDEKSPLKGIEKALEDKDNKALLNLIIEAVSDEVFVYGDKAWIDLFKMLQSAYDKMQSEVLAAAMAGEDPNKAIVRVLLETLDKNSKTARIPGLVWGFKVKDTKTAEAQIKRLEKLATGAIDKVKPLKGRLKRVKVGDSSFLSLQLDGSLLPWDMIDLSDFEKNKGDFDNLAKAIKAMKLSISLGVRDGYLLLAITPEAKDLETFAGKGKALATRDELKPVADAKDKPLVSISYTSQALIQAAANVGYSSQFANQIKSLGFVLDMLPVKDATKKAIKKDLESLAKDLTPSKVDYGAQVAFSYLTKTGYEGYTYDYTKYASLKTVNCKLLDHFGGNPIFAAAVGFQTGTTWYKTVVKYAKAGWGHVETIVNEVGDDDGKDLFKKVSKEILPIFKKLDDNTSKNLLPALKDSGLGIVIDAKWKSKQWHTDGPKTDKAMPMVEPAFLLGISDSDKFTKAMTEYRKTFNELYAKIRENSPEKDNIPEFKLDAPKKAKGKNGMLYSYTLPKDAGFDKQVVPTLGVGKNVSVIAFNKDHAERLMETKTVKALWIKKTMLGGCVFNWPALIDAALPWVEYNIDTNFPGKGDEADKMKKQLLIDVVEVAKVFKCFKGIACGTYISDKPAATVTKSVVTLTDLPAEKKD